MEDELSEFKIAPKIKANKLKQELAQGKSVQELMGFSDVTMAKFYRAAYHLFEEKKYVDAANAFLFLVTLNTHCYEYWLGLGMSTQLNGDYEAAVDAYEMAAFCEIDNPVPYFYLAKCLFAMHDRESALQALDLALEYANDQDEYIDLKSQAKTAKNLLLKYTEEIKE